MEHKRNKERTAPSKREKSEICMYTLTFRKQLFDIGEMVWFASDIDLARCIWELACSLGVYVRDISLSTYENCKVIIQAEYNEYLDFSMNFMEQTTGLITSFRI